MLRLYGLRGITHGGGVVLTVLCPTGASAGRRYIGEAAGVACEYHPGELPVYHELHAGALERLIREYGVREVGFLEWMRLKHRLGEIIYR